MLSILDGSNTMQLLNPQLLLPELVRFGDDIVRRAQLDDIPWHAPPDRFLILPEGSSENRNSRLTPVSLTACQTSDE